ncbi:hypothetical protein F5B17DRAFT_425832 [Nemania serpens]|nr:hypothetical protein F5B17DRAFT_425832 [Nemania serpens]
MAERGPAKKWTAEEKIAFLVKAIDNMLENGAKLSFANVARNMPGRTPKALTHQWAKFKEEYLDKGDAADGQPGPATPAANKGGKGAPANRKRGQGTAATVEDGAASEDLPVPSAKRPRKALPTLANVKGKGKAVAEYHDVDEDEEGEEEDENRED